MDLLKHFKFLFIFAIFTTFVFAINLDEISKLPRGIAKDYYIYRFLNENKIKKTDALALKSQVFSYHGKIQAKFESILGADISLSPCKKRFKGIGDANLSCKSEFFTLNAIKKLTSTQRVKFAKFYEKERPNLANLLLGLDSKNALMYFVKTQNSTNFLRIFDKYDKNFDIKLSNEFANKLIFDEKFDEIFMHLLTNAKFARFRASFLDINESKIFSYNKAFYFAINAIALKKEQNALKFFARAQKLAKFSEHIDNANFWLYLLSKDEKILKNLAKSKDINIYSIFAREILGIKQNEIIVPNPSALKPDNYSITDPFTWQFTRQHIAKMSKNELSDFARKFYTKQTIGHYCFMMDRALNFTKHHYPLGYAEFLDGLDVRRKALIYAIARQESRFIPSAISSSYALGLMQFMPFLANDIAKELKIKNFDQDDVFKPEIAYKFANIHLTYLQTRLSHPLFIAYAYNGGIGFTMRTLRQKHMFKNAKFEPFLSMELIKFSETRDYGKKILANYVVYSSVLDSNTSILKLFESLKTPRHFD